MILADEPVSAVDPERAKSLVELLIGLSREEGTDSCHESSRYRSSEALLLTE
jgi:ABC-type Mn2+/Zn2+ transport system ATPase subunit